ncbi:hypothetical protein RDI58_013141 [Solanum bulbocastanum]|uniref:Uncharacterized protein n=1 Tax=Solanum bulbocastanum TaxID=147425 RepID=A0AAN8YEC7_SOLBU
MSHAPVAAFGDIEMQDAPVVALYAHVVAQGALVATHDARLITQILFAFSLSGMYITMIASVDNAPL